MPLPVPCEPVRAARRAVARRLGAAVAFALLATAPATTACAHSGGPLDAEGCHSDRRVGNYHCHRGAAAGYTFAGHEEMEEAVRTGVFPAKPEHEEGWLRRLWPFGRRSEAPAQAAQGGPAPAATAQPSGPLPANAEPGPAPGPAASPAPSPAPPSSPTIAAPASPEPTASPAGKAGSQAPAAAAPAASTTPAPPAKAAAPAKAQATAPAAPAAPAVPRPSDAPSAKAANAPAASGPASDFERRLRTLDDLKAKGLVTDEEYRAKRREILDEL